MKSYPIEQSCTVEDYLHGVRIDSFLVRHFRNYTSFRMLRLVQAGQVWINGVQVDYRRRVVRGEEVVIRLLEPPDKLYHAEEMPLQILFEDAYLLVVNKPAGVVSHPVGRLQSQTLANGLQFYFDQSSTVRGILRPGIVHRLDRMTSGVMLIAKNHVAHRSLSIQFQEHAVSKEYLAVVRGVMEEEQGSIELPIGRSALQGTILMSAKPDAKNARPARTDFQVVERMQGCTLVRLFPRTGRIHQIRVHLAEIGFPVVGDAFYGRDGLGQSDDSRQDSRHALHAETIRVVHPGSMEPMEFLAPLPDEFLSFTL